MARAVAKAIASAFAVATNDCAQAISAANADDFEETIAVATAEASAEACSTGGWCLRSFYLTRILIRY